MTLHVIFDREDDGRWIADVPALPGVLVYGPTREAAWQRAKEVALETLVGQAELGRTPIDDVIQFEARTGTSA